MPQPLKLFISYRSSDSIKVDKIARDLALLRHDDGTPRYTTWQDKKNLPPASPHWWDAIVDAIIDSQVFVFFVSQDSLKSDVCRAELDYAHKRNRPVIPVVLDGEFFLDPKSAKYNISFWPLVPDWLQNVQFLFFLGADFYGQFQTAIEMFQRNWPRDIDAKRPMNPGGESKSNHALYDQACEYAERLIFAEAEKQFDAFVRRNDRDYGKVSGEWLDVLRLYAELIELDERRNARARVLFGSNWATYTALFTGDFLDGEKVFDPKGFATRGETNTDATPPTQTPPETRAQYIAPQQTPVTQSPPPPPTQPAEAEWITRWKAFKKGKRNADWTPYIARLSGLKIPDMEFCLVPPGTFQMGSNEKNDEKPIHLQTLMQPYWIARTPVTNAQWQVAVKAGAVKEPQGDDALKWYRDGAMAQAPIVGVTWFEAQAFCTWQGCRLPTEHEWEYAARGPDNLVYPWGSEWDKNRAVWGENSGGRPNSVLTHPEGRSWVGALHLSGNVWEWLNSLYKPYPYDESNDINIITNNKDRRVLRGGSWNLSVPDFFRAAIRTYFTPDFRFGRLDYYGFRCVRS